jgi:hypothetical protein
MSGPRGPPTRVLSMTRHRAIPAAILTSSADPFGQGGIDRFGIGRFGVLNDSWVGPDPLGGQVACLRNCAT